MDCINIKSGTSLVRILHAVPQAPAVDVYINEKKVISNLEYKKFSNYLPLLKGDYRIDVFIAGTIDKPVISGSISLEEGQMFTIAAIGNLDNLELLVINDHVDKQLIQNQSAFRIVQISANLPPVNIVVNDKDLVEDLQYKQNISYVDAKPGQYSIELYLSDGNMSVLSFGVVLKSNRIYTMYIVGDSPNISAIQSVDGNTYLCK